MDGRIVILDFETSPAMAGREAMPRQIGIAMLEGNSLTPFLSHFFRTSDDECTYSPIGEIWGVASSHLAGNVLAAHNIGMERTLLRKIAPMVSFGPWIDTLKLVRRAYPGLPSYELEDVVLKLRLKETVAQICPGLAPHDALYDAVAAGAVLRHIRALPGWNRLTAGELARIWQAPV